MKCLSCDYEGSIKSFTSRIVDGSRDLMCPRCLKKEEFQREQYNTPNTDLPRLA